MFAADANPAVDSRLYRCSNSSGENLVITGRAKFISMWDGRRAIQLLKVSSAKTETVDQTKIAKAAYLIGRAYNPFLQPPSLNYEIPHAGDCRTICLRRFSMRRARTDEGKQILVRRTIKVSARKIDFSAVPQLGTQLHLLGVKLPPSKAIASLNSSVRTA